MNCTVVGDQLVMTPTFMGSEPCRVLTARWPAPCCSRRGTKRTRPDPLPRPAQAEAAILRPSIHPDDLPPELQHPFDGRMQAGAFRDNARARLRGGAGPDLTTPSAGCSALVGRLRRLDPDPHAEVGWPRSTGHSTRHGSPGWAPPGDDGPFYYRVQSPVVLIEFDHHPGVVFDNLVPSRNHVHTLMRTPNGDDYGIDLLRQHYDRYDHSHGDHTVR